MTQMYAEVFGYGAIARRLARRELEAQRRRRLLNLGRWATRVNRIPIEGVPTLSGISPSMRKPLSSVDAVAGNYGITPYEFAC